ncbi:MAG: hypothetical protein ACR2KK_02725 [Acidimicrobiales bacterium]
MNGPTTLQPVCPPVNRPRELLDPATTVAGLRAAQSRLAGGARLVDVWLYQDPPAGLADAARWEITGPSGTRLVAVEAAAIVALPTPHVELTVSGEPDVARYRLAVDPEGPPAIAFDPLRTWLLVRMRPECPDLGSCFAPPAAAEPSRPSPVQDYLARDWRSLRRALLEYLRSRDPDADLSVADPTVALVELFAHAGDLLHYRLDRVATEAYLETARLRTSVRRHARLVDFPVGQGRSARTFVHLSVAPGLPPVSVAAGDVAADAAGSSLAFTLEAGVEARSEVGEIAIYGWSEEACCLGAGATECVLVRPQPADPLGPGWLAAGDHLVFEVVDPGPAADHRRWTGRHPTRPWPGGTDALPAFRPPLSSRPAHVVELTAVESFSDPLAPAPVATALTLVRWRAEDALPRPYAVGIDRGEGGPEVTVARAGVVAAHHGRAVGGPPGVALAPRASEGDGPGEPLTAWWLTAAGTRRHGGPGLAFDLRGHPYLDLEVTLPTGARLPVPVLGTLLGAQPGDLAAVVEVEEHEPPVVRFCTGAVGTAPPAGSQVSARYQVGSGLVGNVPANSLAVLEHDANAAGSLPPDFRPVTGVGARNPVPAGQGADPDHLDDVRRDAPEAFAAVSRRAVLPADHATTAAEDPVVARALARRVFAGSWPLITTIVDLQLPDVAASNPSAALAGVQARIEMRRMVGVEAAVVEGASVPLLLGLEVCVRPGVDPEVVRRQILVLLRPGGDGRPGLFHPARLQLGGAVYVSAVLAAVAALPAVDAVEVREARTLREPPGTVREVIVVGPGEVAVLDDDPARPDRGRLDVRVRGGR